MRIVIAGLLGGLVMFLWGFVSHMFTPLGAMGMQTLPVAQQDAVIATSKLAFGNTPGVYMVPGLENMDDYGDEGKMYEFSDRAAKNPYAFVVYQPEGHKMAQTMAPNLAKEFATNVVSAIVAAAIAIGLVGFGSRVIAVGLMGLFAWLAISVPYWNWYRFPTDFTIANLVIQVVGWTLAGVAIAWWLGRNERRRGTL